MLYHQMKNYGERKRRQWFQNSKFYLDEMEECREAAISQEAKDCFRTIQRPQVPNPQRNKKKQSEVSILWPRCTRSKSHEQYKG